MKSPVSIFPSPSPTSKTPRPISHPACPTASFRAKLPESYTYHFPSGPLPSACTPGIDLFYPGPYATFWRAPTLSNIHAAHSWLRSYISTHGPYDGVIGFSQGVALLASFLLRERMEGRECPVKFAAFICGGLPLCVAEEVGLHVGTEAREKHERAGERYGRKVRELAEIDIENVPPGFALWDDPSPDDDAVHDDDESNVFGLDFTSFPEERKLSIPTVHIYGKKDPLWIVGVQLAHLCDKGTRMLYDHGGGHDIPRSTKVAEDIAGMIRKCAEGR